MNSVRLLMVSMAILFLSGCSNFNINNAMKKPTTYMPSDLRDEFVDIMAEDIAKLVTNAYPKKTWKYKINSSDRFGKTLSSEIAKRGFGVINDYASQFKTDDKETLPIGYKIDWIDKAQLYASVTVHVGYRLTRYYRVKGNTISALEGTSIASRYSDKRSY